MKKDIYVDTEISKLLDINCAIIYEHLKLLSQAHKITASMQEDNGKGWFKASIKDLQTYISILTTDQVRRGLKLLEEAKFITKTTKYNEHPMDNIAWWRTKDE